MDEFRPHKNSRSRLPNQELTAQEDPERIAAWIGSRWIFSSCTVRSAAQLHRARCLLLQWLGMENGLDCQQLDRHLIMSKTMLATWLVHESLGLECSFQLPSLPLAIFMSSHTPRLLENHVSTWTSMRLDRPRTYARTESICSRHAHGPRFRIEIGAVISKFWLPVLCAVDSFFLEA